MCGRSRGGEEVSWREEGKSKINKEKLKKGYYRNFVVFNNHKKLFLSYFTKRFPKTYTRQANKYNFDIV
jgi:hypothetical protein